MGGSLEIPKTGLTFGLFPLPLFAKNIENSDRDIDFAVRTASPEMFDILGELEVQLDRQSGAIQYFIDLLKQSRLDESINLDYLGKSVSDMDEILTKLSTLGANRRER